jgi:hypothetical protein
VIRTVPTGDLGLDVLLGGGWRLVRRLDDDRESVSVLFRGGPGTGKTLVGIQAALGIAEALGGDVAVACVEILPTEYRAQLESARRDLEADRVINLPSCTEEHAVSPRVFCGLLTDLDPASPDLVANIEALAQDVVKAGGKPVVFVVDSLIEGYGIGSSVPRPKADALMKFAAEGGYGLVLCEESVGNGSSPWAFAADTVLDLGVAARERGRWIEVRKHRFGASASGQHEIELGGIPAVFPESYAWVAPDPREALEANGWRFKANYRRCSVDLNFLKPGEPKRFNGGFVLISTPNRSVSRSIAQWIFSIDTEGSSDFTVELDPLTQYKAEPLSGLRQECYFLPISHGPARALRALIEQFSSFFKHQGVGPQRVLLGDLSLCFDAPDGLNWTESLRTFASLVIRSGWAIPVVAYLGTVIDDPVGRGLIQSADLQIRAIGPDQVRIWERQSHTQQLAIVDPKFTQQYES